MAFRAIAIASVLSFGGMSVLACGADAVENAASVQTISVNLYGNSPDKVELSLEGIIVNGVNVGDFYQDDFNIVRLDKEAMRVDAEVINVNLRCGGKSTFDLSTLSGEDSASPLEIANSSVESGVYVAEDSINEYMQNEVHKVISEAPNGSNFVDAYLSISEEITTELNAGHDIVAIVTQAIKNGESYDYSLDEILDAAEKSETLAYMLQMASEKGMRYPHLFEFRTTPDRSQEPYAKPSLSEAGPMIYGEVTEARLAALEELFNDSAITQTLALGMTQFGVPADGQSHEVGNLDIIREEQGVVGDMYTISDANTEAKIFVAYTGDGDMLVSSVSVRELE